MSWVIHNGNVHRFGRGKGGNAFNSGKVAILLFLFSSLLSNLTWAALPLQLHCVSVYSGGGAAPTAHYGRREGSGRWWPRTAADTNDAV